MQSNNPQVILAWKAPLRPYKKRSGLIMRFYITLALLLSLIVFFFGDKVLLIPIWAILFLFYVLTITPPPDVDNRITKFGVETTGITLRWEGLSHFYFAKRFGFEVLTLVGQPPYYYHAYLVLNEEGLKKELITLLSEHLIYQEKPQKNLTDKLVDWFSNLLPEDEEVKATPGYADVLKKVQPVSP